MPKLCICQICVCGRHKCPHKFARETIPTDKDAEKTLTSETKQSYLYHAQPKLAPLKQPQQLSISKDPMSRKTTTMDAYPPKKTVARKVKSKPQYVPPKTKMYSQTTYKKNFTVENISKWPAREPAAKGREQNIKIPEDKMERQTTQTRDFGSYDRHTASICKAKPIVRGRGTLTVMGQEFQGFSETMKSYKPTGPVERVRGCKKFDNLCSDGKFEGRPTTAVDYPERKPEPRIKIKPKTQAIKWPNEVVKKVTTYKTDYGLHKNTERVEPCRPKHNRVMPAEVPNKNLTLYKTDYPAHVTNIRTEPPWKPKKEYTKPKVAFADDTTYKKDFVSPPEDLQPEKGKGLETNLSVGGEPMSTMTTHRCDYPRHAGFEPVQSTKKLAVYARPKQRFANESTMQHDFRGAVGERATAIKYPNNLNPEKQPMDLIPITQMDYGCKKFDCPAARLKQGDDEMLESYKYLDSSHGHEFYLKLKPPKK